MRSFEIHIGGYPEGQTPVTGEAQPLTAEEKDAARKWGMSDEQYLRSKLELAEKGERLRVRATHLGELTEAMLQQVGNEYRLTGISRNMDRGTWTLQVDTPSGFRNIVVPWELVDDVLDSRTASDLDRLRNLVLFGIGRRDVIFQGHK